VVPEKGRKTVVVVVPFRKKWRKKAYREEANPGSPGKWSLEERQVVLMVIIEEIYVVVFLLKLMNQLSRCM